MNRSQNSSARTIFTKLLVLVLPILLLAVFTATAALADMPRPTASEKCPVCGMFIVKYPDWTSVVMFKKGPHAFFDGPKCMFKYLLDMKRYNRAKKAGDVAAVWVLDYYTLSPTDARKAWYVMGSDVYGPMGRELIPLSRESDAKTFAKDHKGTRILRFSEVTTQIVKTLD